MKNNKVLKTIYKYRWLIVIIYIFIASVNLATSVIATKSPTFKYEVRCLEPSKEYLNVINTLKYADEITFCVDDLSKEQLNGFYKKNTDYIYLEQENQFYEKTIYHEYSHFLMSKKIEQSKVEHLLKEMKLSDEELTDMTAFFILLERSQSLVDLNQFSYLEPEDLLTLNNESFWLYINEIYKIEGLEDDPDELFDNWIKVTSQKNKGL